MGPPPVIEKAGLTEEDAKAEAERRTKAIGHHKHTVTATRTPDPRAIPA